MNLSSIKTRINRLETDGKVRVKPPLDAQGYQDLRDYIAQVIASTEPEQDISSEDMHSRMSWLRREIETRANPIKPALERVKAKINRLKRW